MVFIKRFCFCLSLEIGTLVIGCLGILQGVVYAVLILTNFSKKVWPEGVDEPYNIDYIRVLLAIAQIVCSVQLVISVKCQRSVFALPWLIVNLLDLIDRLVLMTSVAFGGKPYRAVNVRELAFAIILLLLVFEIWFYCWLCVLQFYLGLRKVVRKSDSYSAVVGNIDAEIYLE